MNCEECRQRLWPDNPTVPQYDRHRRRYLRPLCESCDMVGVHAQVVANLEQRVENLDAIVAEPGSIPRWHHQRTEQLQNQVAYLQRVVNEMRKTRSPAVAAPVKKAGNGKVDYAGVTGDMRQPE